MNDAALNTDFRNGILKQLREKVCTVHFTKADGEKRIMECTLNPEFIPEEFAPKSDAQTNLDVVKAFDVRANGWRSFRLDRMDEFVFGPAAL